MASKRPHPSPDPALVRIAAAWAMLRKMPHQFWIHAHLGRTHSIILPQLLNRRLGLIHALHNFWQRLRDSNSALSLQRRGSFPLNEAATNLAAGRGIEPLWLGPKASAYPLGHPASNLQTHRLHASPAKSELVIRQHRAVQVIDASIRDQLAVISAAFAIESIRYRHDLAEYLNHIFIPQQFIISRTMRHRRKSPFRIASVNARRSNPKRSNSNITRCPSRVCLHCSCVIIGRVGGT